MASAAQARSEKGQAPRLTLQVQADIVSGLRTAAPINWCCEYAGVSREVYRQWKMTAQAALQKRPGNRSQMERRCIEFDAATRQAVADAGMRMNMQLAGAAGLTTARPKRRRTTQRVVGMDIGVDADGKVTGGTVVEVLVVEEELAPDWRALARMGASRFPEELGTLGRADDDGGMAALPREASDNELWNALEQARDRAGLSLPMIGPPAPGVIDATVVEADAEPDGPEQVVANANGNTPSGADTR